MYSIPELEDIGEDVKAARGLFGSDSIAIVSGVEGIVAYLNEGTREYVEHHGNVDADAKLGRPLMSTVQNHGMTWVKEFIQSAPVFPQRYAEAVDASKGAMRRHIYAG